MPHHTVAAVIKIMPRLGPKAYYTLLSISEIYNESVEGEKKKRWKPNLILWKGVAPMDCAFVAPAASPN